MKKTKTKTTIMMMTTMMKTRTGTLGSCQEWGPNVADIKHITSPVGGSYEGRSSVEGKKEEEEEEKEDGSWKVVSVGMKVANHSGSMTLMPV